MFELAVPIRLYWDIASEEACLPYDDVCDDIIRLKILSLNLSVPSPPASPACIQILQRLQGKGTAITVDLSPEACTPAFVSRLRDLGARNVLVRTSSLAEIDSCSHLFAGGNEQTVGISFEVTHGNWRELPSLLSFCRNSGASLTLPMQRLWSGQSCFYLKPEEKRELGAALLDVSLPPNLKVTIHDPFLWKLFFPRIPFPDGGCQAANTMLAVSAKGDVYPCPSLPVRLGNVAISSLREIAISSAKKQARQEIVRHPGPCAGCPDLPSCKGGCRGRAFAANGSLDSVDPGCRS